MPAEKTTNIYIKIFYWHCNKNLKMQIPDILQANSIKFNLKIEMGFILTELVFFISTIF